MKNQIKIEIKCKDSNRWQKIAIEKSKSECAKVGVDFKDADIFVALPEKGRCMIKKSSFSSFCAMG
jgi:hypothetical protein